MTTTYEFTITEKPDLFTGGEWKGHGILSLSDESMPRFDFRIPVDATTWRDCSGGINGDHPHELLHALLDDLVKTFGRAHDAARELARKEYTHNLYDGGSSFLVR
jgi:hypothetical protein